MIYLSAQGTYWNEYGNPFSDLKLAYYAYFQILSLHSLNVYTLYFLPQNGPKRVKIVFCRKPLQFSTCTHAQLQK